MVRQHERATQDCGAFRYPSCGKSFSCIDDLRRHPRSTGHFIPVTFRLAATDFTHCVSHLNLEVEANSSCVTLLAALSTHFGDVFDAEQKQPDAAEALVSDLLAEAVFDDMEATEQTEFPEVRHALMQKRHRERVAEWRMMRESVVPRPRLVQRGRLVRRGLRCPEQNCACFGGHPTCGRWI
jgi:hypothetical protein